MKRGGFLQRRTPLKAKTGFKRKAPLKASERPKVKRKKPTLGKLKKKLWTVFSAYIRARDNYNCFTCYKRGRGKGMHAGHFIPKSVSGFSLYFSEEAVNAQCYNCNINKSGNWPAYERAMIRKHGKERTEELKALAFTITKSYTEAEYLQKISEYEAKLAELG